MVTGDYMNNVLIVDDHPVARLAVRMLLEKDNMSIVGEADDGLKALSLAKELCPDFIVVDIDIPSLNGIDLVKCLRSRGYEGGILVLSGKDDEHYVKRCASAGADGFISKRNNLLGFTDAMRAIKGGYGYYPRDQSRKVAMLGSIEENGQSKISTLSDKELQVLRFLVKGIKVVDISVKMQISDKTVSTYKRRLMLKLELKNMVELYDFSQRNNID